MSRTLVIQPEVADADRILAATALTTGAQTITTALAQPDCYRVLSITGNSAGITGNVVISGTDWDGDSISDTIALSGASTVVGLKPFRSVSSLTLPIRNAGGDTVSIGVAAVFGFPHDLAAVSAVERAASTATSWTSEAVGTVSTTYGTLACTVTSGDRIRITYTEAGTTANASRLFTVAEARSYDKAQLADAALYTAVAIQAAETDIRREFEQIIGCALLPTRTTETLSGEGGAGLYLSWPEVQAITVASYLDSSGTEYLYTATEIADMVPDDYGLVVRRDATWPSGHQNVKLTYLHGMDTVPGDLKEAALMTLVRRLVTTDLPWESTGGSFDGMNWSSVVDPSRNRWYGNDKVDGVLLRYRERYWRPGIA